MLNYNTERLNQVENDEFLSYALEECKKLSENEGRDIPKLEDIFKLQDSDTKKNMEDGRIKEIIMKISMGLDLNGLQKCPHCGNKDNYKYGKYKNRQRYKCRNQICGRTFTSLTSTVFASSKKSLDIWFKYIVLMFSGATLRKIGRELKINIQTAFNWRHKILKVLKRVSVNRRIGGLVQIGEVKFCERWGEFRSIRRLGTVYTAVEHTGKIIAQIAHEKEENSIGFMRIFGEKLKDQTYIARPQNRYHKRYIDNIRKTIIQSLEVMQWNNRVKGLDCFKIAKVNMNIKMMIGKFRGMKRKYTQDYLNWYMWSNDSCLEHGAVSVDKILNELISISID